MVLNKSALGGGRRPRLWRVIIKRPALLRIGSVAHLQRSAFMTISGEARVALRLQMQQLCLNKHHNYHENDLRQPVSVGTDMLVVHPLGGACVFAVLQTCRAALAGETELVSTQLAETSK